MNRPPRVARLAAFVALAAALGLAACGKKGPLDPPPMTMAQPGPGTPGATPTAERPAYDAEGKPVTPVGEHKRFVLDWLLN